MANVTIFISGTERVHIQQIEGMVIRIFFTYKDYFTTVCKFLHLNLKIFYIKGSAEAFLNIHNFSNPISNVLQILFNKLKFISSVAIEIYISLQKQKSALKDTCTRE